MRYKNAFCVHYNLLIHERNNVLVQQEDLVGFEWIQLNTSENATIFTSWSDGGGFLPIFTYRRGIPTMFNIFEDWMNEQYFKETGWELNGYLISNPDHPRVYQLLNKYNITYIYCGESLQP